ncbi:hypothetical protein NP493_246g03020 [Ridgeia piscesae]|uniref:Uncharacterized protein n=1 Tax=Ridgeia piscesae TaxID=27915 RepID=A0AAD9NZ16_RIDPI|nr:hypothetical protein NP493_246g03020 [Ridgeia piscesae]
MALISLTIAFPSGDTKKITYPRGSVTGVLKCDLKQLGQSVITVKEDANKILTEAVHQEKSDHTRTESVQMLPASEDDNGGK